MEVTRKNFQSVLEELDGVLDNASFLGIDGEFTGLNSGPDASAYDTPAQYYAKLRTGSMDFLLVQFGLSVFTFNQSTKKYLQRSYNFYVFPKPLDRSAPDCRFMCQASSMSFLADRGFDFNKLFNEGIPYLTTVQEEKLVARLEDRQRLRDENMELIPISEDDRPQIEEICSKIDHFLNSEAEELIIDRCNAFIRRIIHQEAKMRWPNKARLEAKSDIGGQWLLVQKMGTKEEEEQKEAERREREENEIKQAVGLSALLRKIADSGKLIVGHNMLFDLCHIVHQFFAPLPTSYYEFKSLVHSLFPRLLDTKIMCQSPQFRESIPLSVLNAVFKTVSKTPYSMPEVDAVPNKCYTTLVDKSHEAGYDAFITGLCFIAMSNYLGSLQMPEVSVVLPDSPLLNPFVNKLFIARLKDLPYIDLAGKDPNPSRDHVFHISFPREWKLSDISQVFSPFGGSYVSWLSDTTAYVALNRRDQSSAVAKHKFTIPGFQIQKFSEHQAQRAAVESDGSQGFRKRKLSSPDNAPAKEIEKSGTNEEGNDQEEGWEMATGNDELNSSLSWHQNRDIGKDTRTDTWINDKRKIEESRCARKVRLKNALSLPTEFRNGKGTTKEIPKYTILRRSPDQIDIRNLIEISDPPKPRNAESKEVPEMIRTVEVNEPIRPICTDIGDHFTITETDDRSKKQSLGRTKSNPVCSNERAKSFGEKSKHLEYSPLPLKRSAKITPISTPTGSPNAKRSPSKRQAKYKSTDLGEKNERWDRYNQEQRTNEDKSQEKCTIGTEKQWNAIEKQRWTLGTEKNGDGCHNISFGGVDKSRDEQNSVLKKRDRSAEPEERVELNKPSMKLLRNSRKRPENVLLTGSILFRVAQVAGVLLLLYIVTIF